MGIREELGIQEYSIKSHDGTRIAYQRVGTGPLILLANGLGGSIVAYKHVIEQFKDQFSFLAWDYRGFFNSHLPEAPEALTLPDHCGDLAAILDHEGIDEPAILMGWSMGVQVSLEFAHLYPERIRGLVLVNGTYGHVFKTTFNMPFSSTIMPLLVGGMKRSACVLETAISLLVEHPATIRAIKRTPMVASTLDESVFHDLAKGFKTFDMRHYFEQMEYLAKHSTEEYLAEINAPTLIVHGEHDVMTPHPVTQKLLDLLPRAELFTVPGGSHYSIIEYPEVVNLKLGKFFADVPLATASRR